MTRRANLYCSLLLLCLASPSVLACEIRVRDAAFRMPRDVHSLCVVAEASDEAANEIQRALNQWLEKTGGTINLEVVRINSDDPEMNWRSIGIPSAPPSLPVTVLVGRDKGMGQSFVIEHWEPAPTPDQLAAILDSPARQQLAHQLARNMAVLVFAPANPESESPISEAVRSAVERGIASERIGLSMVTLDRNDAAEQLLARFMGLRPSSPDTLCVAFGPGKLMTPPLVGNEITLDNIEQLVTQLRQACSCSKPLSTMGVDVPLIWSDLVDSSVVLMDDEIELSDLDVEVQAMLIAKSTSNASGPTVIAIPPGRSSLATTPVAKVTKDHVAVGAIVLFGIAFAFWMLRSRLSEIDSSR